MSKIVIDARESGTSTGRYIDKLIEYLYRLEPELAITILTKSGRVAFFAQIAPTFAVIVTPFKEFTFAEQLGYKAQLDTLRADLVHFGMVQQPVWYRGAALTTIHDLTTVRFANPDKNRLIFAIKQQVYKFVIKHVAHKSKAILTPSQFVKDDLVAFCHINPDKITVTYEAADKIVDSPVPFDNLLNKKFIMYVGRPTPHKNLERLIAAFARARAQHPDLLLVLAGKKDANYRRIEEALPTDLTPYVTFTDFVSEGQLRWLYEHCAAYVFPSLSEGFGLPGLEAMLHKAPVLSSNASCLPEVYGDAAHYFDPLDTVAMATAINEVLSDAKLRQKLITAGSKRVAEYSWERMAKQTLAIYKKLLE